MTLDYIYHSGFAIEAEVVTVIIDYYKDSSETEHNRGTGFVALSGLSGPGRGRSFLRYSLSSRRIAVDSCGLCADGSSCIDYGSYCFSLDEGGLRFGSRYVVWKYGESDGIELCE